MIIDLFRLKALKNTDYPLFSPRINREEFIERLLTSKPSSELRSGYLWHIGNVQKISNNGMVFAIGKTVISSSEIFDEISKDFIVIDDEESPFTYVFYDITTGVIGIVAKYRLSSKTKTIASNLENILNRSNITIDSNFKIEIDQILNPESFIEQLHNAHVVYRFKMNFGEPNPIDVDEDFHAPMEKFLEEARGTRGYTVINGEDLDRGTLEELARSAASVGNNASAGMILEKDGPKVNKQLKGNPAQTILEDKSLPTNPSEILFFIKETYKNLRKNISND